MTVSSLPCAAIAFRRKQSEDDLRVRCRAPSSSVEGHRFPVVKSLELHGPAQGGKWVKKIKKTNTM